MLSDQSGHVQRLGSLLKTMILVEVAKVSSVHPILQERVILNGDFVDLAGFLALLCFVDVLVQSNLAFLSLTNQGSSKLFDSLLCIYTLEINTCLLL